MNELVLAAGSVAGIFTAVAMGRAPVSVKQNEGMIRNNYGTFDLEKRIVYEAMRRVYDYERAGKITSAEREKLLQKYRRQLDALNTKTNDLDLNGDVNSFKKDLIALVDQKMSQINAKLDDLARMVNNGTAIRQVSHVEVKEDKPVQKKAEQVTPVDANETSESDASLDEIKKQIMQTLSRLEQAEVE